MISVVVCSDAMAMMDVPGLETSQRLICASCSAPPVGIVVRTCELVRLFRRAWQDDGPDQQSLVFRWQPGL